MVKTKLDYENRSGSGPGEPNAAARTRERLPEWRGATALPQVGAAAVCPPDRLASKTTESGGPSTRGWGGRATTTTLRTRRRTGRSRPLA